MPIRSADLLLVWLVCLVSDLVSLLCYFQLGVVPSAVPANFCLSNEGNSCNRVGFTVASKWEFDPSMKQLTRDSERGNPCSIVGILNGGRTHNRGSS